MGARNAALARARGTGFDFDIEQRLALFVSHHGERALERGHHPGRRGNVLAPAAAGLADLLELRRRIELRHARAQIPQEASLGARELADALRVLTTRERAVVVLHYYEGRSIDEVAEILGCPRGTAASLQSRALAKLRKVIER